MLILAVAVPLAAFDVYNASKERNRWIDQVEGSLDGSVQAVLNKVSDLIESSHDLLVALSVTEAVAEGAGTNLEACSKLLHAVGARYTKYSNFSVVNAEKFIVCSSGPLPKPVNVANSPNINDAFATKAFAVSPFKFGVLTGKPILVFSEPLLNAQGEVWGAINTGLNLNWLGEYLASVSSATVNERLVMFDGQGTVLAAYPETLYPIGSSIGGADITRFALASDTGRGRFRGADGEEMFGAHAIIPRIPGGAHIVAFAPVKSILEPTMELLYQRLLILAVLIAGTLIIGWLAARVMIMSPIDRLITTTRRIEDGDMRARSDIDYAAGEVGMLARAFDEMADALEARTEDLKDGEANYRELVESEEQLIHRFLPDSTELFVNGALANFFGGTPADWVGRRWLEFITPNQRHDVEALMKACTPEHPAFVYEMSVNHVDGEERWLRWNNHAFFDKKGNITHFQAVGFDMTERRLAETALERAMMDARAASRAKSNFLANMSHELRTPLNSIIGFSEMMTAGIMGKLPDTYREYAGYISSSGHHLLNIINDLLDLSKIEAGMMKLDETEFSLATLVNDVATMLKSMAETNKNQLVTHFSADGTLRLRGDRLRIKQVLLNVLSNAIKFTKNGTVTVEALNEGEGLILRIIDTGIGMSDDDIRVALSPFGQVDNRHLSKRYEGTGLGLPLAEQLMEMHGGILEIQSELGKGTSVTLRFPPERTVRLRG